MAEIDRRKAALIAEIEVSRSEIRTAIRRVERAANIIERARRGITANLSTWLIGASIGGFLLSKTLSGSKRGNSHTPSYLDRPKKRFPAGILVGAVKVAFDLARPALLQWAASRFVQSQTDLDK